MCLEIAEESLVFATDCTPEHDFVDEPSLKHSLGRLDSIVLLQFFGFVCCTRGMDDSSDHLLWLVGFFLVICD